MNLPTPGQRFSVYIVEDDDLLRQDIARAVEAHATLRLLGCTGSAVQARRFLQDKPELDVLLVDLGLPDGDGTDLIRVQRRCVPQARALVMSTFDDDWRVLNALAAGAQGYLLKDVDDETLLRGIFDVLRGDAPLSPQIARYVLRMFDDGAGGAASRQAALGTDERLTPREVEVLTLVGQGESGPQVAQRLGLSLHTVSTHLRNCRAKLAASNRVQAVNRARQSGQIG